jgi:acetylornithine/succinyldiaminopimelate/putrescine aminotransferase
VQTIEEENLLDNVAELSERFRSHFAALADELSIIAEIRTRGMMIGVELTIPSTPAVGKCMEKGLLINATQGTVIRLLPAVNISAEEVDEGFNIIANVLREMANEAS